MKIEKFLLGSPDEFSFNFDRIKSSIKLHGLKNVMDAFVSANPVLPWYRYGRNAELDNMLSNPAEIWLSRAEWHRIREQDESDRADPNEGKHNVLNRVGFYSDRHRTFVRTTVNIKNSIADHQNYFLFCHSHRWSPRLREENEAYYIIWPWPVFLALINLRLDRLKANGDLSMAKFEGAGEINYTDAPHDVRQNFSRPTYHGRGFSRWLRWHRM